MKKIIIIILVIVVLAIAGFFSNQISQTQKTENKTEEPSKNTASLTAVDGSDSFGIGHRSFVDGKFYHAVVA